MNENYACHSPEHGIARRQFLGRMAGGLVVGGLGLFGTPTLAAELTRQQKRVVVFNMYGGLSQLESWDPKPGTDTGGPFRAIATSVPGIHLSELLPLTATQMHHLCIARGVNTSEDDHAKGAYMMTTGRREMPGVDYPKIGAVVAKALADESNVMPGHIMIAPWGAGGRQNDAAYLGPQFSSMALGNGNPPANTQRPEAITEGSDAARNDFRRKANERFLSRRRTALTDAYTYSYEQAQRLMTQRDAFDVTKESPADLERYGSHDFGRHCLLARRLLEKGVTFVQVIHGNYDTHNENFNFHFEQVREFDRGFGNFIRDLAERGMLESTAVVVLSEFGRTPNVNVFYGRDHWSKAWSVCLAGGRFPRGAVYGKTNERGTEVVDGQVDHAQLFHTYLQSVGIDSSQSFNVDGREMPIADPAAKAVEGLLA